MIGVILGQSFLNFINASLMFFPIKGRQFLSILYLIAAAICFYLELYVPASFLGVTSLFVLCNALISERRIKSQQVLLQELVNQQIKEGVDESKRIGGNVKPGINSEEIEINESDNTST